MQEDYLTVRQAAKRANTHVSFWHKVAVKHAACKKVKSKHGPRWHIPLSLYNSVLQEKLIREHKLPGYKIGLYLNSEFTDYIEKQAEIQGICRTRVIKNAIKAAMEG